MQESHDNKHCGAYVCDWLWSCVQEIKDREDKLFDPLRFRREALVWLRGAPRQPAQPPKSEGGADSDPIIIDSCKRTKQGADKWSSDPVGAPEKTPLRSSPTSLGGDDSDAVAMEGAQLVLPGIDRQ